MNEVQIFEHPMFGNLRMVMHDGTPMFVGVDVTRVLEYAKPSQAVIDHCRGIRKLGIPSYNQHGAEVVQETNCIPEGDIYRLITKAAEQSRNPVIKEKAERFERWIYDEVLPSITKHGMYITPQTLEQMLNDPAFAIAAFTRLKEEQDARKLAEKTVAQQTRLIAELAPKGAYCDLVLLTKDPVTTNQIAKDYGKSAVWLNKRLHELDVQYNQGGVWLLYQKYADKGYARSRTHTYAGHDGEQHSKQHTCWTQKGRMFIYELLKKNGIVPIMEREYEMAAQP